MPREPDLAAARNLGPRTVALQEMRFSPSLGIDLVREVGGVKLDRQVLQVIDIAAGKGVIAPIEEGFARRLANALLVAVEDGSLRPHVHSATHLTTAGGSNANTAVHDR